MSLLKALLENYYFYYNIHARIYIDITPSSINEFITNVKLHKSIFNTTITEHIFAVRVHMNDVDTYLYETFIHKEPLLRLLTSIILPFNHKITILFVTEDYIDTSRVDLLTGNAFVVVNTISECNSLLQYICKNVTTFLSTLLHNTHLISGLTKNNVSAALQSIKDRNLRCYIEEITNAKLLLTPSDEPSLYITLNDILHNANIEHIARNSRVNDLIDNNIITFISNISSFQYKNISIDELTYVRLDRAVLKSTLTNA